MAKQQKLVLIISILASFVAFLDGSVVNVALPAIMRELGGGLAGQQWVVDAYLISLGSLILIAGSLSDLYGRKKVLVTGLIGFAVASLLCALAPNDTFLIISRGIQGLAGALLVPSSLALIISAFRGPAQSKAIGTWTGWTGISFLIGPVLGGFLVQTTTWRLIFAINIIPIAITLWLLRSLKQPARSETKPHVDIKGALLCIVGLGGSVFALIEYAHYGWTSPVIYVPLILGVLSSATFIWYEDRTKHPMLPLGLFKVRNFLVGNIATISIYAGLSVATFLVVIFVQQVAGYSALQAGLSLLPVTLIMFFLSPKFGGLAGKFGPRFFMAIGPIIAGAGFLIMLRVSQPINYWSQLFPGVMVFGLGLSMTVAPLTSAVLGAVKSSQAGISSAVNNAVSRIAGLIGIAAIGVVVGENVSLQGFHRGITAIALLLVLGGAISFIGIRNPTKNQ
ncbi:MAG TPA: MFS transporter [Candidatus Saccharimonadales bacterium]|nr:MFS transporter [Candidatus Saccharimonadales bacterium]